MHPLIFTILLLLLLLFIFLLYKRCSAIKAVRNRTTPEKLELLTSLIAPFGYSYEPSQDIISSRNDAWQRTFGYRALFDEAAVHLNMVFNCLPVYFDYQGKTWLLELWKGQYGINIGGEIGLYHADTLIAPKELSRTHFDAVSDTYLLPMSMRLSKGEKLLASISKKTWWLTAFSMGQFTRPEELCLNALLTFPNYEMQHSFLNSLLDTGFSPDNIQLNDHQVCLSFCGKNQKKFSFFKRLARGFVQCMNRLFCKLYLLCTRPFTRTIDRLLYLYYLLPILFRHTLRLHRYKKKWNH